MTTEGNRTAPALRRLAPLLVWLTGLVLAAFSLQLHPAQADDTGSSGSPVTCGSLATATFKTLGTGTDNTDDLYISGFVSGSTVTVGYRNNKNTGSFQATVARVSGPTISPTSAGPVALGSNGSGSTTFSYVSGSGTLRISVTKSAESTSPAPKPEYSVTCSGAAGVTVTESGGSTNVVEGGATDGFNVVLDSAPSANVVITVGSDAQCTVSPTSLTFMPGNWNTAQTVTVSAVDDDIVEGSGTCQITTSATSSTDSKYSGLAVADVTANVTDNDLSSASIAKAAGGNGAEPGSDDGEFSVALSKASSTATTVNYTVGGTATPGTGNDYATLSGSVVVPANSTTVSIPVDVLDDAIVEALETVSVTLTSTSNTSVTVSTSNKTASLDITDNDSATVSVAKATNGAESGTNGEFTVTMSAKSSTDTTVSYSVSGTATPGVGNDYTTLSGSVAVPAGSTTASIAVTVLDDALVEGTETVTVTLSAATSNPSISASGSDSIDITDDDTASVTVAKTANGAEPGTNGAFTVTMSAKSSTATTVSYTVGGTATPGTGNDYTALSGSVIVPAGSTTANIAVTVLDDTLVEDTETVAVTLSATTSNSSISASGSDSLEIADDDTATVSVAKTTDGAEPGTNGEFRVTMSAKSSTATTVSYTVGGTATPGAGNDYTTLSGSVIVPAGSTTASIAVAVLNDSLVEETETVTVTLTATTSNSSISASGSDSLDITDDDTATVSITKTTNGTEPGTNGEFTVTMSTKSATPTTVSYTAGGTATPGAGNDFTALSGSVVVPAGSTTASIPVGVLDDALVEGTETVTVTLTATTSNSSISASGSDSLDITDDDTATVSVAKTTDGAEPDTNGEFTVTMSAKSSTATTVSYTVGGTATPGTGNDYTTLSGSVVVPAGSTTASIPVAVLNDTLVEGTETVSVTLSATTSNSSVSGSGSDSIDITDDDTATVSIAKTTDGAEPGTDGEFTVTMSIKSSTPTTVSYTAGGTATPGAGNDYTTLSGSVVVPAGSTTSSISVEVLDDPTVEGPETVSVTLTGTSNTAISASGSASLTIEDNETAQVTVTESSGTTDIAEGGTTDGFTVVLSSQPTADVTIALTPDTQCTLSASSLTFTSGNWNLPQTVTVTAVDDGVAEGAHSCVITTGDASGDGFSGVKVDDVTANVTDNDSAAVTVTQNGGSTDITEGGATDSFTIVLNSKPAADVTILLSPDAQCTLSTSGVTFTSTDWSSAQGITVTAVNDNVVEGAHKCEIATTATSSDTNYNGADVADVTANVTDNDTAGVTVAGSPVSITEGGATGDFTVVLASAPTADVTLSLSADAQCILSASSLTFTPGNWNASQSVTVTAVDDAEEEGAHNCLITTGDTVSSDGNYNGLAVAEITANIADNDSNGAPSASVVRKTFENETHNFMAERMRMLARLGPRIYRMTNRANGEFQTGSNGFNVQGDGGNMAGNFALNTGGVRRILNGEAFNVTPTADAPEAGSAFNAWVEGQFAYYKSDDNEEGNPEGNFFVGYAGVDMKVHDGVLIGIMGQLDWYDEDTDIGETDGTGWMVGPYVSAQLAPNLFFDLRGMYGRSDNSSTQDIQNFEYEGHFDTDRYLVEAILSGRFDYGDTVLTPDLQFIYIWEDQEDYTVSAGGNEVDVDGQLVKLGQLSTGLRIAERFDTDGAEIWPYVGGRVFWDFDNPGGFAIDGGTVSTDDVRAAISLGLDVSTESSRISLEATYDGLFSSDYEAIGGRVVFSHQW